LLLTLARAVILGSESHGTYGHILLSQVQDSPNLEGQVPIFITPRKKVAQLYPRALGSLFVASYDSQGYSGVIRIRLHVGMLQQLPELSLYNLGMEPPENTISNSSSIVAFISTASETSLSNGTMQLTMHMSQYNNNFYLV
jgi:hypothetical protein